MDTQTIMISRNAKDPERTRADILQASLEEFARHGFEAATVRGIAARIGMSHGMIRYHYETKEKLWFAAVEFLFERLQREVRLTPREFEQLKAGNLDVFRAWLKRYVYYCAAHPEHARIMMQESVAPSERLAEAMHKYVQESHHLVREVMKALQSRGVLPANVPPESLIYIIAGACQNFFALAPEAHYALDYDALSPPAIDAHADAVIAIFCPP